MQLQNPIINNTESRRFETDVNGELAYIEYRFHMDNISLMHTFVPESARGQGVSEALAKFALEYIQEQNLKVIVYCPFVAKYITRHQEYQFMVDTPDLY